MTYREFFNEVSTDLGVSTEASDAILANMKLEVGLNPDDNICAGDQPATPQQIGVMKAEYSRYLRSVMGMLARGDVPAVKREIDRCQEIIVAQLRQN